MEKPSTVKNQKLSQKSNKRKPVKVVYISNPMKIKTTPSEFRAIVQQLTGRYATSPPSPDDHELAASGIIVKDNHQEEDKEENQQLEKYWHSPNSTMSARNTRSLDLSYHQTGCRDDQVIMENLVENPQMLEGFPSLLPSDFGS